MSKDIGWGSTQFRFHFKDIDEIERLLQSNMHDILKVFRCVWFHNFRQEPRECADMVLGLIMQIEKAMQEGCVGPKEIWDKIIAGHRGEYVETVPH